MTVEWNDPAPASPSRALPWAVNKIGDWKRALSTHVTKTRRYRKADPDDFDLIVDLYVELAAYEDVLREYYNLPESPAWPAWVNQHRAADPEPPSW